jgi:ribosomal protein L37AE/L43A
MRRFEELIDMESKQTGYQCSICGRYLYKIKDGKRGYWICKKCRVLKFYKGDEE